MFTMVQTSRRKFDNGKVVETVYRDRERGATVIHYSAHRGGSLYLGSVTIRNLANGESFTYSDTAAPDEISPQGAASIAARHWNKVK